MVFGAHVVVVRQQSQHRSAFMVGIAAGAARLGLVAPYGPIRGGVAQFRQNAQARYSIGRSTTVASLSISTMRPLQPVRGMLSWSQSSRTGNVCTAASRLR
ncbi:hypothetical protein A4G28_02855 [Mycobacterium ostraviense]|uniref:Uncharacterized protein n=1 Tax=Mycobacterium ostraviense TaxID=2738409 RepID=A0A163XBT6_9MYCO|nr:hypothetical protein A4G28_02855 [Mycobacterium ostraviense]